MGVDELLLRLFKGLRFCDVELWHFVFKRYHGGGV